MPEVAALGSVVVEALPAAVHPWPELADEPGRRGFRTAESVGIAASFFRPVELARAVGQQVGDRRILAGPTGDEPSARNGLDGGGEGPRWVDPETGEISAVGPLELRGERMAAMAEAGERFAPETSGWWANGRRKLALGDVPASVSGGQRAAAGRVEETRVVLTGSMRPLGRGRWVDCETGEIISQILDRELVTSQAPTIRVLGITPARLHAAVGGLSNAGAEDRPIDSELLSEAAARAIVISIWEKALAETDPRARNRLFRELATAEENAKDMRLRRLAVASDLNDEGIDGDGVNVITEFSDRSRARCRRVMADIDWVRCLEEAETACGERVFLTFVTFTLPAQWRLFAPSPEESLKLLDRLFKRLDRALNVNKVEGFRVGVFWKREFQRRGAPHWHCVIALPAKIRGLPARRWLLNEWSDVVGDGSSDHLQYGVNVDRRIGIDASGARNLSQYLSGYLGSSERLSDKEIQHEAPEGFATDKGSVGRWWARRGLHTVNAEVRVTEQDLVAVMRLLRAHARSQKRWIEVKNGTKTVQVAGVVPRSLGSSTTGFSMLVDDGPALAINLARYLDTVHEPPEPWPPGVRRPLP